MRRPRLPFLSVTIAAAQLLAPLAARADAGATAAPASAAQASAADPSALEDPNADRSFLMPTALTQPQGTLTISNYEILMLGLTLGVADRVQVGFTGMLTLPAFAGVGTVKWQFLRAGRLRLAALGGAAFVGSRFSESAGAGPSVLPQAGLAASYCLSEGCRTLLNLSTVTTFEMQARGVEVGSMLYSAGATFQLASRWKLLTEVTNSSVLASNGLDPLGTIASAAVRWFGRRWAVEGGVMALIDSTDVVPLPFFSFSLRP